VDTPMPTGETSPIPVTTTLLFNVGSLLNVFASIRFP
jgi:hypothetical protein